MVHNEIVRSGITRSFWTGFFASSFWRMFYQDLIGQDKYIRMVETMWLDIHWIVGFSLTVLCIYYYSKLKTKVCGRDPLP